MTLRWRTEEPPWGLEGVGQMGSKAEPPGCWGQAAQGVAQATGGPEGWRWQSGVQQGQGWAQVGQQGGEQGQGVDGQAVDQE